MLQAAREMQQAQFVEMQFTLYCQLLAKEYEFARIDQRKATKDRDKDAKLMVNIDHPLRVANAAVGKFLKMHYGQPPKPDDEKSAEELRKELEAKADGEQKPGLVLPE